MAPTSPNHEGALDLLGAYQHLRQAVSYQDTRNPGTVLPDADAIVSAVASLPSPSSDSYLEPLGASATLNHLHDVIIPGLNNQSLAPRYYGFVVGGVLPIAEAADNIVSAYDQNVQVHLPSHSAATAVEDAALTMVISLLDLGDTAHWTGRTFTTGATASNIMGLACGREAVLAKRGANVGDVGLLRACEMAGVKEIQVLTSMAHSSLKKAASVVGLGRASVKEVGVEGEPWRLDLDALERELKREDAVSIIAVSAGEVNTGRFATNALDMPKLRSLADRHGAWIHVDGAFGIFARCLPRTDEFLNLHATVAGLELADSIAADGHKILNVPYDTGIFLCRDVAVAQQVFQNPNAAYLAAPAGNTGCAIHSPLNVGIENSRRFRALPVYAVLLSEGRDGISAMITRMVTLARAIASFIRDSEDYDWLPREDESLENSFMIVLFRAKDPALNDVLVDRINKTGKMFVSGTQWDGQKAARIAVSNWRVDVERDLTIVQKVLNDVVAVEK
ncbi:hypothetical protein OQA88_1928 [Cercophora sp. LCS_1]